MLALLGLQPGVWFAVWCLAMVAVIFTTLAIIDWRDDIAHRLAALEDARRDDASIRGWRELGEVIEQGARR